MKDTTNAILNPLTGEIKISDQLIISKNTKPGDLFAHYKTNEIEVWDVKTGFVHYTVRDIELQNQFFYFSFCFFGDRFDMLTFGFNGQPGMLSWDDWSQEKEMQKMVHYDHWLNKEIGTVRVFQWGKIKTFYDFKGGGSGIVLRYT